MTRTFTLVAAGVLSFSAMMSTALAGSVTQPGETVGLPTGTPLPPGLYFVNTADWGCRDTNPNTTCVGVDIPVVAWSTPWTPLGARLHLLLATPVLEVGVHNTNYQASVYNPLLAAQLAWDLGNGWGVSYLLGAYFEVGQALAWDSTSLNQRFAVSYTANGWNLTANLIWGIQFDHVSAKPQISPCPAPFGFNGCNPDFLNLDLTATKKFGKWELGVVAFGSTDLNRPIPTYAKQSQFAVGGLVGYDFGPVVLQGYLTTDVAETNYGGHDTRGWARIIIPIWNPPAASPVIGKGLVTKG